MENSKQSTITIQKTSGDVEVFSVEKLTSSLKKAGATEAIIEKVTAEIQSWVFSGATSRQIYQKAFGLLKRKQQHHIASRYKLKQAIMELGPTGYPFERFVAEVMQSKGYETTVGKTLQGQCVTHEVDVVLIRGNERGFVECKYGTKKDRHVNVKVPLYIRSRVNDLIDHIKQTENNENSTFSGWLVTNTRFTSDAIAYGTCSGLKMLSWDFPEGNALKDIVDREKIYPVTVLTRLTKAQQQQLIAKDVVTCRNIAENHGLLDFLQLSKAKRNAVLLELQKLIERGI